MATQTISISQEEYALLKKKEVIADDLVLQLDSSLKSAFSTRVFTGGLHQHRH